MTRPIECMRMRICICTCTRIVRLLILWQLWIIFIIIDIFFHNLQSYLSRSRLPNQVWESMTLNPRHAFHLLFSHSPKSARVVISNLLSYFLSLSFSDTRLQNTLIWSLFWNVSVRILLGKDLLWVQYAIEENGHFQRHTFVHFLPVSRSVMVLKIILLCFL